MSSGELDESLLVAAADHAHVVREPAVHPPGGNRVLVIVILIHTSDDFQRSAFRNIRKRCTMHKHPNISDVIAITLYRASHLTSRSCPPGPAAG